MNHLNETLQILKTARVCESMTTQDKVDYWLQKLHLAGVIEAEITAIGNGIFFEVSDERYEEIKNLPVFKAIERSAQSEFFTDPHYDKGVVAAISFQDEDSFDFHPKEMLQPYVRLLKFYSNFIDYRVKLNFRDKYECSIDFYDKETSDRLIFSIHPTLIMLHHYPSITRGSLPKYLGLGYREKTVNLSFDEFKERFMSYIESQLAT